MADYIIDTLKFVRRGMALALLTIGGLILSACQNGDDGTYEPLYSNTPPVVMKEYVFGVHPLHNPKRLHEVFGPLMRYLEGHMPGASFRLEASRDYAAYDEKLYAGRFDFSLPNPFQTVNSLETGYRVFGKMGDDHNFHGIILVRKDSGINSVLDLKGKAVSFPAPTALAATMMPQYYMQTNGLDVMSDIDVRYVGSQESSIMNVFLGDTVAAATWPPPWRLLSKERPELARELEIKWETMPLPNNGLVVRSDVSVELTQRVGDLMFNLHQNEQGREILARMELSRFETANNDTYSPVIEFISTFETVVRPVK